MNEPLAPAWLTRGLLFFTTNVRQTYLLSRVRARSWGSLPQRRGATMVIANHQHEDESEFIIERLYVADRWRRPIYTASSRRLYEPGFFAQRLPALAPLVRRLDAGAFFIAMGMLPIENQLAARPLGSLAAFARRTHGNLPLAEFVDAAALAALPGPPPTLDDVTSPHHRAAAQATLKVGALREPYRGEALAHTRAEVDADVARIRGVVAGGATFFVTAEGTYSGDGRLHRLRGIVKAIAPIADVWLCAIAYDVFRGERLSMLYRLVRPADPLDLAGSLAAARPLTASALLGAWLAERDAPFGIAEAVAAVATAYRSLPRTVFVDPELANDPAAVTQDALRGLVRIGALTADGARYRRSALRAHPRFPGVADMLAFQATLARDTIEAARRLDGSGACDDA